MTGFIFLDKPGGLTSFTSANLVRKICGASKGGHTGTLDPMATGVLSVMLDGATRFSQYLPSHDKAYITEILLGTVTDSLDITGNVTETHSVNVSLSDIESAVCRFKGKISQYPPMYSAVSKNGVRLYKLARQGIEIEREAREVEIFKSEIIGYNEACHEFTLEVSCSTGTYIRSLAFDIGEYLGCGATVKTLRRTSANGIGIERTVTLEKLRELSENGSVDSIVASVDEMLDCYPEIHVTDKQSVRFFNGGELSLDRLKDKVCNGIYRVYSSDNRMLGLGKAETAKNLLKVEKILVSK